MQRRRLNPPPNKRDKTMRLNGLAWIALISVLCLILTPFTIIDNIYCTVSHAGLDLVNGYYVGLGGETSMS